MVMSIIGVSASYLYSANQIAYKDGSIEGALNDLYNGKKVLSEALTNNGITTSQSATFEKMAENINQISLKVYESGSISIYVTHGASKYVSLNLKNSYVESDNAYLIIDSIMHSAGAAYINGLISGQIIGNNIDGYIWNGAGTATGDVTFKINYSIIKR